MTKRSVLWLCLFCFGAMVLAVAAGWENSATNDEPEFLFAAYAALKGKGLWVPLHPPLYKLVAGNCLALLPIDPPAADARQVMANYPKAIHTFLHENRVETLSLLRAARLGMLLFLALLGWGTFRLGEIVGGRMVGLFAALAVLCQPLVLGHAFLVHTDVPTAACWVWAFVFCERWLLHKRWAWLGLGVWVGLALATKQSSVLLVLFLVLRVLVAALKGFRSPATEAAAALGLAFSVLYLLTAFSLRQVSLEEERTLIEVISSEFGKGNTVGPLLKRLASWNLVVAHHLLGLAVAAWKNNHGQGINFFLGQTSPHGFLLYFPLALVAKLSAPFTLVWIGGFLAWRRLSAVGRWCLGYAGLYLLSSLGSSFNIGARHLMPVVPLLGVVGGTTLAALAPRWRALAAGALVASPLIAFPHYIAHFSLLTGGARFGEFLVNDSNWDWGQDWARLAKRAKAERWFPLYALYLGPDDPSGYGVPIHNILMSGELPQDGFWVVSSYAVHVGPAYLEYKGQKQAAMFLRKVAASLQRCQPMASVGRSLRVYLCGTDPRLTAKTLQGP